MSKLFDFFKSVPPVWRGVIGVILAVAILVSVGGVIGISIGPQAKMSYKDVVAMADDDDSAGDDDDSAEFSRLPLSPEK
jgi:FlaG/FlaF family flagellin (archaellin)